ncbi:amylo-alpha-1,6-glucosidase [Paenibacillus apiarius]|uniref:amylo-alpha-1,6-glucosidase n=1 Tax=Paenibacillus apiarius TaxID=46240 RepID=UPI00300D5CEC
MQLDISRIPFSRFGSYFAVSIERDTNRLIVRDLHGGDEAPSSIFVLELMKHGQAADFDLDVTETRLRIIHRHNHAEYAELCISGEDIIHCRIAGASLKLTAVKTRYDSLMPYGPQQWEYHLYSKEIKLMFTLLYGDARIQAPWKMVGNDSIELVMNPDGDQDEGGVFVIESYKTVWRKKEYENYARACERVDRHYEQWLRQMPAVPERYEPSRRLAAYITWSCVVHPEGQLNNYAMYMSKNWMFNIWSWDNCFNAMMLSERDPMLALAQLDIFMAHQDESGIYADFINDKFLSFNCCKPPIHAWAFARMRERNAWFDDRAIVARMYDSLARATNYWLDYRRPSASRLPVYNHGNDSGWDNASIFHDGIPVEAPDLAAHLIRQMDILSGMAAELERADEAKAWTEKADELYGLLMDRLYRDGRFVARYAPEDRIIAHQDSLILYMPLIIGYRLPSEVTAALANGLTERFEADYGLCTESYRSPLYRDNGYWLGPIWAPVTYLFIDALRRNGYNEFASRLAAKFMDLTLAGGMAENFDPFSGKGLVDPAFTWTSSVFLMLARESIQPPEEHHEKIFR